MTFDQKIQVWVAVGTWLAGLATLAATVVALRLARQGQRIQLKVHVGIRELYVGDGTPAQDHVCIDVTNLGDRPVTVNTVGWAVGKGKRRKYCIQPTSGRYTSQYPVELAHGKNAKFMVSFTDTPSWANHFATGFIENLSERSLKSLVAQVHTSVGTTIETKPESGLLELLRSQIAAKTA